MATEIALYPAQRRAWQARGRELLVGFESGAGASFMLRVMACLMAASRPGVAVVIAVPDPAVIRPEFLDGPSGLWRLLDDAIRDGSCSLQQGGVVRFANGSSIQVTTWAAAARRSQQVLLIDDADELGWGDYQVLREKVLSDPSAAAHGGGPALVVAARRPTEGWVGEHWRNLPVDQGAVVQLVAAEIPEEVRAARRKVARPALTLREYADRVRPGLEWHYHTAHLADVLQRVIDREVLRLLVFAPPRYGKSEFVSRITPAYQLHRRPESWVGLGSSTATLALSLSKDARSKYREGGGVFREDSQDAKLWRTERGGGMWARGVGGTILGFGFGLGIVDDPFKSRLEASQPTMQAKVEEWFWGDFYSRRELGEPVAIVVMHQRLHENDLAGRLLQSEMDSRAPEGWEILNLPAIKREREYAFPPNCHVIEDPRPDGAVLAPELQSLEELQQLEDKDPLIFASIYQQEPKPSSGGGVFQRHWWPQIGEPEDVAQLAAQHPGISALLRAAQAAGWLPSFQREVRSWDLAATLRPENAAVGAQTVGVRAGLVPGDRREVIFTDVVAAHVDAGNVKQVILDTAWEDGTAVEVVLPIDPGAAGKIVAKDIEDALKQRGHRVIVMTNKGSKRQRATPHAGAACPREIATTAGGKIETPGRCAMLRADWNDAFAEQHHRFDGLSGRMDIVDAGAFAFNCLAVEVVREATRYRR